VLNAKRPSRTACRTKETAGGQRCRMKRMTFASREKSDTMEMVTLKEVILGG